MTVSVNHEKAITFLVIAAFSTLCSLIASHIIWSQGSRKSVSSQLLLLLHGTLLFEEISSLPYAYSSNNGLCRTFGFFHVYSGLANIVVIGLLTLHYCNHVLFSDVKLSRYIRRFKYYWIFGLPCVALLPFTTNSYGIEQSVWCTISSASHDGQIWFVLAQFAWIWGILVLSIMLILYVIYRASQLDHAMAHSIFSSIGIYVFVSVLCWIPRSLTKTIQDYFRDPSDAHFWTTLPLYLAGLCYGIILMRDRKVLKVDDSHLTGGAGRTHSTEGDGHGSRSSSSRGSEFGEEVLHFSWEEIDKILEESAQSEDRLTTTVAMTSTGLSDKRTRKASEDVLSPFQA